MAMAKGARREGPKKAAGSEAGRSLPPGSEETALIGKRVVDTEGLELGYVDEVRGRQLRIGEGPLGESLLIPKSFVGGVGEEIQLIEPLQELLKDVEVFDSLGRSLGWVSDVMATGDVVDGCIVKGPGDSHFVILEHIRSLGGTISLDISLGQLKDQEGEGGKK